MQSFPLSKGGIFPLQSGELKSTWQPFSCLARFDHMHAARCFALSGLARTLVGSMRERCWLLASLSCLDSGIPLIPLILPISPLPTSDAGQRLHQFDLHDILRLFVSQLPFKAEPERGAMWNI